MKTHSTPLAIQELGNKLGGLSLDEAVSVLQSYFAKSIWSLEKDEWDRMTDAQKRRFAASATRKNGD